MQNLGGEDIGQTSSMRKVVTASLLGSIMEWYDFFLFGTAAALVLNELFFPNFSPLAGTLAAFATFGVGFVMRPVGAVIFGHFGDRIGRKSVLVLTLLIMGIATTLIGLLPTYSAIGIWAPILLVVLRLFQGLGIGGEWGGAALMTVEHSPRDRRGFYGSLPQIGTPLGLLLSTGVFAIVSSLPEEQFLSWGWRVPFLVSILLLAVGLYIRLSIVETPAFERLKDTQTEARLPLLELVRNNPKNMLLSFGARLTDAGTFNVINVFGIGYATEQLGLSQNVMLSGFVIASAIEVVLIPIFGALSDRIGRRPVYMAGVIFSGTFIYLYFLMLSTGSTILAYVAIILALAVGTGLMFSLMPSFFSELFGTNTRYTGISLAYQASSLVVAAPTPALATALVIWAGGSWWPVAVYLTVIASISAVCIYLASETFRDDIVEQQTQEDQRTMQGRGGQPI